MEELLLKQKVYDGTLEWNNAGWTGKGINVWNMENFNARHGKTSTERIKQAAPDANVFTLTHFGSFKDGKVVEEHVEGYGSAQNFIETEHISICTVSVEGYTTEAGGRAELYKELKKKNNLVMFTAAGNNGPETISVDYGIFMYVGAANFLKDKPVMASYSSGGVGKGIVDFTSFSMPGNPGTSFSCPYLAGIASILQQRYGTDMSYNEIYEYFKMIAQPILTEYKSTDVPGYDYWSGWGIPILPSIEKQYIVMEINKKTFKVDGKIKEMNTSPFIKNQRTFVPISFIALALKADVSWDDKEKMVTIIKNNTVLQMYIDKNTYLLNGKPYMMDAAPFIKDSRTFVPIAFVATALNCKVSWVAEEAKVLILEQ